MPLADLNLSVRASNLPRIRKHHDGPRSGPLAVKTRCSKYATSARPTLTEVRNKLRDLGLPPRHASAPSPGRSLNGRLRLSDTTNHPVQLCDIDDEGRKLGRAPSHQRALFACPGHRAISSPSATRSTTRNKPKVKGRMITTIFQGEGSSGRSWRSASRSLARGLLAEDAARQHGTTADRGSDAWKTWRKSDKWRAWNKAVAPAVAAPAPLPAAAGRQASSLCPVRHRSPAIH